MGLIDIRDGCPSPADPTDRVRALISALDDDDIKRGEAVLSGLAKAYRSDDVELLLAFDRQCEDPGEPSWKVLIRSVCIACRSAPSNGRRPAGSACRRSTRTLPNSVSTARASISRRYSCGG